MTQIQVIKRDGSKEELDIEKMHKVVMWATEGITGVSASEVELKSHIQFYTGIKTGDIQETLIKSAADLISEETPNYQYVAGKTRMGTWRALLLHAHVPHLQLRPLATIILCVLVKSSTNITSNICKHWSLGREELITSYIRLSKII